ncbi:MAG: metallophosphoesterase [Microgenomates group bacterium]
MRILVFSDTHLTDNFEEKRYKFLKKIIENSDQVIINGDFWDGYVTDFDKFTKSEWSNLFSLLKSKKTTYLFGNHDKPEFSDRRTSLFSTEQQQSVSIKTRVDNLIIEHGDKYLPFIDAKLSRKNIPKSFARHSLDYESFLIRNFGTTLIKNLYQKYNNAIKEKSAPHLKNKDVLVCGHTHLLEIDLKAKFINSGLINYGLGQYLLIEGDKITDKEEWYDIPAIEGMLDPALYMTHVKHLNLETISDDK